MGKERAAVSTSHHPFSRGALSAIFLIAGIVGTIDILLAFFQHYVISSTSPLVILKFIASGVFGNAAFKQGNMMAVWGLIFHFLLALTWTTFFFFTYPTMSNLLRNKWVAAGVIAVVIWTVMNLLIVPLSHTPATRFQLQGAVMSMIILFVAMGIPLSFFLDRHYRR